MASQAFILFFVRNIGKHTQMATIYKNVEIFFEMQELAELSTLCILCGLC